MKEEELPQVVSGCAWFIGLIVFGIAIAIGIATGNFWVGAGVCFSLVTTLGVAIYYFVEDDFETYLWTWGSFFLILFLYAKYGQFGHWWWMVAWFLTMLAHGTVGIYARQQKRPFHGMMAGALALLSIGAGLAKPLQIAEILVQMKLMHINDFGDSTLPAAPPPATLPAASTNFWMWALLILGFVFLIWAWNKGYFDIEGKPFIALASIGVGLLAFATWLSGFRGGWWWALPWGLAALMLAHAAHQLREYYEPAAARFGTFLVILCLLSAVGGPYAAGRGWLTRPATLAPTGTPAAVTQRTPAPFPTATVTITPQPQVTPTPSTAQTDKETASSSIAAQQFLLAAVKSVWGIFHLAMLLLLGYSWFKNGWGALAPLLVLLIGVWIAGNSPTSTVDETLTHLISSSPAGWMRALIGFSVGSWGYAGWGILLLGIAVSLALFPAQRQFIVSRYKLKDLPFVQRLLGTTIAYEYMKKEINPTLMAVNTLINPIISLGLFIALWVALRQISNAGDVPLAAWGIPDLSVPSWRPVWQWPYFAVAGALALAQIVLIPLKRKFNILVSGLASEVNAWYILVGTFVVALFVPAGVLIFLTAQAASQLLLVPLVGREIAKLKAEEQAQREGEERKRRIVGAEERRREEEEKRKQEEQKHKEREKAHTKKPAYELNVQPAGMALQSDLTLAALGTNGTLFLCRGSNVQKLQLPIPSPMGLMSLKEDGLLVVAEKQALCLSAEGKVVQTLTLTVPANAFALNPYKTMLAYLAADTSQVRAIFLEARREIELASELPLGNALTFSADGRELAVALTSSRVYILNIASRQKVAELHDPAAADMTATLIAAAPDDCWLVVLGKKRLVRLNKEKQVEISIPSRTNILSLSLWAERKRILLGCQNGSVRILDFDFTDVCKEKIDDNPIISVACAPDGNEVFALTQKGALWRVKV